VHWVIYNIPIEKEVFKSTFKLLEDFPKKELTEKGIRQGTTILERSAMTAPALLAAPTAITSSSMPWIRY